MYMKKKHLTAYIGYLDFFFQNYPCKHYLNVHFYESGFNSVLILSCEWGVSAYFFFFNLHRNCVFGADCEVINTLFYHWKFYEKKMCLALHIWIYRFSFCFQNYSVLWNTIVTLMKVISNSILISSSEGVLPRKILRNLHQNGVL